VHQAFRATSLPSDLTSSPGWKSSLAFLEGLEFDIYIPSMRLAIEYQGVQHFKPISRFGGEEAFIALQRRDARKRSLAARHKIRLYEWHYEKPISEKNVREIIEIHAIRLSGCEANSPS
jgi:hypothetical protein